MSVSRCKCEPYFSKTTTANANANPVSQKQRPQMQIRTLFPKNNGHKYETSKR